MEIPSPKLPSLGITLTLTGRGERMRASGPVNVLLYVTCRAGRG
jgi:hypothetical protein